MTTHSSPNPISSAARLVLIVVFIVLGTACLGSACCPFLDAWARALCGAFAGMLLISTLVAAVGADAVERAYRYTTRLVRK